MPFPCVCLYFGSYNFQTLFLLSSVLIIQCSAGGVSRHKLTLFDERHGISGHAPRLKSSTWSTRHALLRCTDVFDMYQPAVGRCVWIRWAQTVDSFIYAYTHSFTSTQFSEGMLWLTSSKGVTLDFTLDRAGIRWMFEYCLNAFVPLLLKF